MKVSFKHFASLFLFLVLLSFKTFAQPAAGDMVVLGIDAVNDKIIFATLVDIDAGTEIKITDRGWDNTTSAFTTSMTGDGVVTWTPTVDVAAGAVLSLVLGGSDNTPVSSLTNVTANTDITNEVVFSTYSVSNPLIGTGDQVFIYRGADTNPYFIFGLNASGNTNLDATYWQTAITGMLIHSMLPDGVGSQNRLTAGVNAVGILTNPGGSTAATQQFDNVFYNGPISSGDKETWLARIVDDGNWGGDDSGVGVTSVGTALGTSVIALPVVFSSIKATRTAYQWTLSWQTLSETNNDYFEVQTSPDGSVFTSIAAVPSQALNGNSDSLLEYNFTFDWTTTIALSSLGLLSLLVIGRGKKATRVGIAVAVILSLIAWYGCSKNNLKINDGAARVYIRLAQVDKDGTRSYSKVIVIDADR